MHAEKNPDSFTSTRITNKTLSLLNKIKALKKVSTHDELIFQMLLFFENNDLDPANFKKPVPEQIADLRDTFVKFFRTFENEKLLPYVQRTDQSLILILEILQNMDLSKLIQNVQKQSAISVEKTTPIIENSSNNDNLKIEVLKCINELENNKQFNQRSGTSIVEIRSIDYEDIIKKMKKLCL